MAERILKTRSQKLSAWKATERMADSWLDFLATVPANTAMTDSEWFQAWRKHAAKGP